MTHFGAYYITIFIEGVLVIIQSPQNIHVDFRMTKLDDLLEEVWVLTLNDF